VELTIGGQSAAKKLRSAMLRVYDNIITSYASPEVQTLKPQSC
jgi:hypothetical protein